MSSMTNIHTLFGAEEFWVVADSEQFLTSVLIKG